jgi:sugar O-acyltransferase (sialic acid O-acetyltransferase NeuD family)
VSETTRGPSELLIVGAGGLGRETAQAVAAAQAAGRAVRVLGFLDDDPLLAGTQVGGTPVLGGSELAREHAGAGLLLCVAGVRDPLVRLRVARRMDLPAERYATFVHPSVEVSQDSTIGAGSILLAQSVLTAAVRIGEHVVVMPRAVLTHDDVLEDYATLASGVNLAGGVHVERGAYIGAGATVREYVRIGAGALVGMGSVVLHDIPSGQVWAGNPARHLRTLAFSEDGRTSTANRGGS